MSIQRMAGWVRRLWSAGPIKPSRTVRQAFRPGLNVLEGRSLPSATFHGLHHGADDPAGHHVAVHMSHGADNVPGDIRHGRGADDPATHNTATAQKQGADNVPGDVRHGRGADDPSGHK